MSNRKFLHISQAYQKQDYRASFNKCIELNIQILKTFKADLSENVMANLQKFDEGNLDQQRELLTQEPLAYLESYQQLIVKTSSRNTNLINALLTINGILIDSHDNLRIVRDQITKSPENNLLTTLTQILYKNDIDIIGYEAAANSCALILGFLDKRKYQQEQKDFLLYILTLKKEKRNESQPRLSPLALSQSLVQLIKHEHLVKTFTDNNGFELIQTNFNDKNDLQIHYYNLILLWAISETEQGIQFFKDQHLQIIYNITQNIQRFSKEKVIRIASYIFRNLENNNDCLQIMIDNGVQKICENQLKSNIRDEKIIENLTKLAEILEQNERVLSNFEKYEKELLSGVLKWGPIHSEKFWKEHYLKFESNEFKYIKELVKIIKDSNESIENIAIACNDLGEFSRFHSYGAQILDSMNAKQLIMNLANKDGMDPSIRENALIALQKIMLHNWQQI